MPDKPFQQDADLPPRILEEMEEWADNGIRYSIPQLFTYCYSLKNFKWYSGILGRLPHLMKN
jgi:hypothetical protein